MSCTVPYLVSLSQCPETIKVWGGLLPNTNYAWLLKDIHGIEYWEYVVTDASGAFEIDCTSSIFPGGLFNYNAGRFSLEVFRQFPYVYIEEEGSDLTFCGVAYDSVLIQFVKQRTTQNETLIQHIRCQ